MRKTLEHILLPVFTIFGSLFFSSHAARAEEAVFFTEETAFELGIDFRKAKSLLVQAGIEIQDDIIGVKFHEESNQVDLSGLDSISVIVDWVDVANVPDNGGEGDGWFN